ncbi:MAG: molybdenum cofactor cytidylyltransferase [Paraglaciecola psychrophila]
MATIGVVVLAAGRSRRFGGDKRQHLLGQQNLLQHSLSKPLSMGLPTRVVLRPDDGEQLPALLGDFIAHPNLSVVYAAQADDGMGHSLACAAAAMSDFDMLLVLLADMPWIEVATIELLLARGEREHIVLPLYQGRRGHPVLFGCRWFEALQALGGDSGARELLRANPDAIDEVVVRDPGVLRDVDTPQAVNQPI